MSGKELSTEELVVMLLQSIEQKVQAGPKRIRLRGLHANGRLGVLPGIVDDTITPGDPYYPGAGVDLVLHEETMSVWVYDGGKLQTVIPQNGVGSFDVADDVQLAEPAAGTDPVAPQALDDSPSPVSDQSAEELARTLLGEDAA